MSPRGDKKVRTALAAAFLLFAAALFVAGPAEASRTTDARSSLAAISATTLAPSSLELSSPAALELVEPTAPIESSPRFGFAEDLALLDPKAGPGGFVVFAAEAAQCELTYARNNPLKYVDPDGKNPLLIWGSQVAQRVAAHPATQRAMTWLSAQGTTAWNAATRFFNSPTGQEVTQAGVEALSGSQLPPGPAGSMLDAASAAGARTGTVWDFVRATQDAIPGTVVPRSFVMTAGSAEVFVAPNATKHVGEYLTRLGASGNPMSAQAALGSLQASVGEALKKGVAYGEKVRVGQWELIFRAGRKPGELPALVHAQPLLRKAE